MAEHTWAGHELDNPRTLCVPAQPARPLGAREAFLVAYERLALLARVARGPAFVVAAVDPRARVIESLRIEDGGALVIGRHTQSGLRLGAESTSLRHLAALVRFEADEPVLRLWDLRSALPFVTEDGQPNAAVIAQGPLYAAVEGFALWFLPTGGAWPGDAEAAWRALPSRSFLDRRPPAEPGRRPDPPARRAFLEDTTLVTRIGPPLLIGDGDEPEIGWGEIRLADRAHKEKRVVSAERLEQGILLGRYERCGLMLPGHQRISRVHLLLVRIGVDVWAIDTASTHGVRRGDAPFSAGVLRDTDTLTLAGEVTLDWHRTVHAEA